MLQTRQKQKYVDPKGVIQKEREILVQLGRNYVIIFFCLFFANRLESKIYYGFFMLMVEINICETFFVDRNKIVFFFHFL